MAIPRQLIEYLDSQGVGYQCCRHSPVYTAQGVAHAQHISGKKVAKVVIVSAGGRKLMAVVPACHRVDLEKLENLLGSSVRLASEGEFQNYFPDCELGAMPPFGHLYNLDVWVDAALKNQPDIIFKAGTHLDTIQMSFKDFEKLVRPKLGDFSILMH